jgi:hypothetical protein
MAMELLGLAAGMAAGLTATLLYLRHLRWKAIARAYEPA